MTLIRSRSLSAPAPWRLSKWPSVTEEGTGPHRFRTSDTVTKLPCPQHGECCSLNPPNPVGGSTTHSFPGEPREGAGTIRTLRGNKP